ncbi:MAG TPA: prepilin-type N-terminal cleavage/methylation domain-containing protein [Solirubrobacteraceae bacterium]|nr:prepilin-type N-terminal cleavage/methylation domain-containing protein [Solirubrobacteraceae bacterium]
MREESGFTLIELLVSMALSLVVMGAVITLITVFLNDTRYDGLRDQAQTDAKVLVDRLSRELRSAASTSSGSSGLLEKATSYDIVFQTVNPNFPSGSTSNSTNQYRVRYCLDSNNTLWRQSETWTTATAPSVPDTSNCPSTSNLWAQKSNGQSCCVELTDVTNEIGGDTTRPLFTFGPSSATTGGVTDVTKVQEVQMNIITDLNPGHLPGPSPQLTSGIFFRNENSPPVIPDFTVTSSGSGGTSRNVTLNASQAYDPNGQTLQYQWYANSGSSGSCASSTTGPSSGSLSNGAVQIFSSTSANGTTFTTASTWTFALVVTDTQGLTACYAKTVTIS